jgi:hypothetical protein
VSVTVSVSVPERQKSVAVAVDRRNVKRASSPVILFLTERSFERREKEILTQRPLSNAVKDCGLRISDCGIEARAVATVLMLKRTLSLTLTLTLTTDYYLPNAFRLGLRETQLPSLRPYQSRQRKLQIGQGAASR